MTGFGLKLGKIESTNIVITFVQATLFKPEWQKFSLNRTRYRKLSSNMTWFKLELQKRNSFLIKAK